MRVAVMAAGAVGGYFGARLAAAGHDVTFFARGAHLDAIRRNGLRVESGLGDIHLNEVKATDDPASVAPVDVVLFAVKLWDTERAAEPLKPLVRPHTRVITLQNGIDSVERLTAILGADAVVGGTTYLVTMIAAPGLIRHTGPYAVIRCGRVDGRADPTLAGYVKDMRAAGIDITLSDEMQLELWKKFVLLAGTSGITASTRQTMGVIRADPDMRALLFKLTGEATAVAKAAGIAFAPDFAREIARAIEVFPPTMKASMANDLEAGNRLELDWLAGKVVSLGRALGVPTPANEAVYAILKAYRMGSRH
ncbi:MAG TPA: 2-dehydropantoate 2-reductase [Xanthobacteraceae bacterium]